LTELTKSTASVTMAYDAADQRTSLTLPNGIVVESSYDAASHLTGLAYKLGGSTLGTLDYTYDGSGQRTALGGTYARTGLPAALGSATFDDANQIAAFGGTSFSYDANGNLTSDGTNTYSWNARHQLSGISGGVSASFAYDAAGRRRAKTIGGTSTQFLYDGLNPVQELASGIPTANLLTGFGLDEYFTRTDGSGARNVLADAQGSNVALTDGSGIVQAEYTYEAFGKTTTSGAPGTNAFGFTGQEADGTGLHFYRARYYDARLQRFIGEDPLGFAAGDVNLHAYVSNAPVDLVDPTGELAGVLVPIAAGCLGGAAGAALAPLWGRKVTLPDLLDGCFAGIPFGLPGARPLVLALRPLLAPLIAPLAGPIARPALSGPTERTVEAFRRQLVNAGPGSLAKSLRNFEANLLEHQAKLEAYRRVGGPTSSIERRFE
jgi:RHS repeat-associated protein